MSLLLIHILPRCPPELGLAVEHVVSYGFGTIDFSLLSNDVFKLRDFF